MPDTFDSAALALVPSVPLEARATAVVPEPIEVARSPFLYAAIESPLASDAPARLVARPVSPTAPAALAVVSRPV